MTGIFAISLSTHAQTIPQRKPTQRTVPKTRKIVETKQAGYVSESDAVKEAVRELLRKHKLLP